MTGQTNLPAVTTRQDIRRFQVTLDGLQLEVCTLPGLPDWELTLPSARLVAENLKIHPGDQVLLLGCQQGEIPTYLAKVLPPGHLTLHDHNFTALEATQLTLCANAAPQVEIYTDIDLPPEWEQKFRTVVIQLPKGRQLWRRWLLQAQSALSVDGSLYLVGSNRAGIQTAVKDAQELFGAGRIVAYKKGNRLAHFVKRADSQPPPGWTKDPGIAPHTWVEFPITLSDHTYYIRSLPGVFSYDRLDEGTEMLLGVIEIPAGAKVLDAGCGNGVIGLYAADHAAGYVHLVDNSLLAVAASRATLVINGIHNAEAFATDLLNLSLSEKYDLVLSNPPFHAGHAVDYRVAHALIENSLQALNPGGRLVVVANRFIRYNRLIKEIFGNVSILTESGKFHVLSGLKSS